ncbi:MAG: transposase [Mycobacteriaceae bacterium]|nr:transposase [Mycobacteriaceae bacterium]
MAAKGLTTGGVAAHFPGIYGATVSKDTISRITGKAVREVTKWCNRPLELVAFQANPRKSLVRKARHATEFDRNNHHRGGTTSFRYIHR